MKDNKKWVKYPFLYDLLNYNRRLVIDRKCLSNMLTNDIRFEDKLYIATKAFGTQLIAKRSIYCVIIFLQLKEEWCEKVYESNQIGQMIWIIVWMINDYTPS